VNYGFDNQRYIVRKYRGKRIATPFAQFDPIEYKVFHEGFHGQIKRSCIVSSLALRALGCDSCSSMRGARIANSVEKRGVAHSA
jgi:hypothetical protein